MATPTSNIENHPPTFGAEDYNLRGTISIDKHVVTLGAEDHNLRAVAKRYTQTHRGEAGSSFKTRASGASAFQPATPLTLLLVHALGSVKEAWEPTITRLFELDRRSFGSQRFSAVWSVDCADHGESASLNDGYFSANPGRVSAQHVAKTIVELVRSHLLRDGNLPRLVLAGHCRGGVALALAMEYLADLSPCPISSFIMVEPGMVHADLEAESAAVRSQVEWLVQSSALRRDVWSDAEEAHAYFRSKGAFKLWDPRSLDLYVKHGFRTVPSPTSPLIGNGVTLSYPKEFESAAHADLSEGQAALKVLSRMCREVPVHWIFGARQPTAFKQLQDYIRHHVQPLASVTYLPDTGHSAVQECPDMVANVIWDVLTRSKERSNAILRGKL